MSKKGFTLVEVTIVSLIFLVLVGFITIALLQGMSIFQNADISETLQGSARAAINRLSYDLMRTTSTKVTITQNTPMAGSDKICYQLPNETAGVPNIVSGAVDWSGNLYAYISTPTSKKLVKDTGGVLKTIGNDVTSVRFINHALDATLQLNELKITLSLQKTGTAGKVYSLTYTYIIAMRN